MKNRSLTVFSLIVFTLGLQHVSAATALLEIPKAPFAKDFKDANGASKGLLSAALLTEGLSGDRYEEFNLDHVLGGLDYVSSEALRFAIPSTQYEVVASWGFGGSGKQSLELMLPLPDVSIKLEVNDAADVKPVRHSDGALTGLGKIIIQNELNKLAASPDGDLKKILKTFGITPTLKPRAVFLIKLALLLNIQLRTKI